MHEVKWRDSSLTPLEFMEERVSRHNRSMSDPVKRKVEGDKMNQNLQAASYRLKLDMTQLKGCVEAEKRQSPQNTLKQEIQGLQKRLQDQIVVRRALEKALSYRPFSVDATHGNLIPKPAEELIKEVAVLELEVVYLEQYLLSMYRKTFDRVSSLSTNDEKMKPVSMGRKETFPVVPGHDITSEKQNPVVHSGHLMSPRNSVVNPPEEFNDIWGPQKLLDSSIHRSHSSLSQRSEHPIRTHPMNSLAKAVDLYHSLPLSMLEQVQSDAPNEINLAEHLGSSISDHVPENPNSLSEEMIKYISAIYCKLADPPLVNHEYPSSPTSFSSPLYEFSSQGLGDTRCQQRRKYSSFNSHFDNPFQIEGSKEFSGPYSAMVKVQWICRDSQKLREINQMLHNFRSLVYQLEEVDPRKMKYDEKLAFWINVHNALVMHAFLVYGIPQNNLKRMSLLLKAAYNVGGHTISIEKIQNYILGCRLPHPGQWLRFLFPLRTKFKIGDARKVYAIEHPEPLLYFALCSGSHSDPAVRKYTPKRVFQELEAAKEDYIRSTFSVKEHKIHLPKIVESFAKDSDLCPAGLLDMIQHFLPDSARRSIPRCQHRKFSKSSIDWIPHNFTFRYLLSNGLTQ